MKRYFLVLVAVILFSLVLWLSIFRNQNQLKGAEYITAKIGKEFYKLEIANTNQAREKGLGGRSNLPQNSGMFFIFDRPGLYQFWMQGMQFPLDFIWLDGSRIIQLTENVLPPCSSSRGELCTKEITVLKTNQYFDKVIELNAGEVKKTGIKIGDSISIKINQLEVK